MSGGGKGLLRVCEVSREVQAGLGESEKGIRLFLRVWLQQRMTALIGTCNLLLSITNYAAVLSIQSGIPPCPYAITSPSVGLTPCKLSSSQY